MSYQKSIEELLSAEERLPEYAKDADSVLYERLGDLLLSINTNDGVLKGLGGLGLILAPQCQLIYFVSGVAPQMIATSKKTEK